MLDEVLYHVALIQNVLTVLNPLECFVTSEHIVVGYK